MRNGHRRNHQPIIFDLCDHQLITFTSSFSVMPAFLRENISYFRIETEISGEVTVVMFFDTGSKMTILVQNHMLKVIYFLQVFLWILRRLWLSNFCYGQILVSIR